MGEIFTLVRDAIRGHRPAALATVIEGPSIGAHLFVAPGGEPVGTLGNADLDRVVTRDALGEIEAGRAGVRHYGVNGEANETTVSVFFPEFDLDQRAPVADVLKGLGVTAPFETETDFAPMTSDPEAEGLHVDDVLHQATVTVDEFGTEASAATAVTMSATGAPIDPVTVKADRPFLFVIHDVATGTPMFLGRVADPTTT